MARKSTKKPAAPIPQVTDVIQPREKVNKGDFVDRVVERSGLKRRDVKPAVEAMFEEFAELLLKGEDLVAPPLGKLRVAKVKELPDAKLYTMKIRIEEAKVEALETPLETASE